MSELKTFTIDRQTWIRGEGSGSSFLLCKDGRKCCLGFFSLQQQLTPEQIDGSGGPKNVLNKLREMNASQDIIKVVIEKFSGLAEIMQDSTYFYTNTVLCWQIMKANDTISIDDSAREKRLTELFQQLGYQPIFEN